MINDKADGNKYINQKSNGRIARSDTLKMAKSKT